MLVALLPLAGCADAPPDVPSERLPAGVERVSYAVPAIARTISTLRAGAPDGRRVVFVHGTPGEATGWAAYLADVPAGYEYVAVDRLGFGSTRPDDAEPSLARQAAAIAPLLVERRGRFTILVSHSLGGAIVARFAADYPERVSGIAIIAGSLDPALERIHPMQPVGEYWGIRSMLPRTLRNANRELLPLKGELTQLSPLLPAIRTPVSIVHGDADKLVPVAAVAFMRAHFTSARVDVTIVTGQDHFVPWNSRAAVDRAIASLTTR